MKKKLILIFTNLSLIACTNQPSNHFTEEQTNSLGLNKTSSLIVNPNSVKNIDLNQFLSEREYAFSSLIEEVKLIPLETKGKSVITTEESLLSDIYNILVTSTHIYVHDKFKGGGIVIFDREGKFIRRIPNGQGPGELMRLYDMSFDSVKNEFVAYIHSFLLFYTPTGEFIRQERLPFGCYNFMAISDGYIFKTLDGAGNEHLGSWANNTLLVTNKDYGLKLAGLPVVASNINYSGYHYLYKNKDNITITRSFVDTIFQYTEKTNELSAKYVLDYNEKELPSRYLQGTSTDFHQAIARNDYYYFLGEYLETDSQNVFFLRNNYKGFKTVVFRDKETGNLQGGTFGKYEKENDLPSMGLPIATSDEYLISLHLPNKNNVSLAGSSLISDADQLKIKNLTEDDNPVLVFFKMKNF